MIFEHKSVLLYETVDSLNIKPDGIYVDGTLGGGGHAYEVLKRLGPKGRLIGIDQDADAIQAASGRLKEYGEKVTIVRSNYRNIKEVLSSLGIEKVDGIYLDLGVSSYQLDTAERGFTYRETRRWICVWTRETKKRPRISSMNTARWSCTGSSVITVRTGLRKILQSTL